MDKAMEFFVSAHNKKRLSHLYLLYGEAGSGKIELAFNVCELILKEYDKRENILDIIKLGSHSQIYHVKPEGTVIKKKQILDLQEEFSKTSLFKMPRIYIIEDIDLISSSAANSLLKFMEEPENNLVYGILVTTNLAKVLPTIISRSQVIRINRESQVKEALLEEGIDSYVAKMVSYLTKDFKRASELVQDATVINIIEFIQRFLENLYNPKYYAMIDIEKNLPPLLYEREYYQIFLELILVVFVDLWRYTLKEEIAFTELQEIYAEILKKKKIDQILKIVNLLQEEIAKQSYYINISLSLEVLMINIQK